jgi:hypothetical protein
MWVCEKFDTKIKIVVQNLGSEYFLLKSQEHKSEYLDKLCKNVLEEVDKSSDCLVMSYVYSSTQHSEFVMANQIYSFLAETSTSSVKQNVPICGIVHGSFISDNTIPKEWLSDYENQIISDYQINPIKITNTNGLSRQVLMNNHYTIFRENGTPSAKGRLGLDLLKSLFHVQ